MLLFRYLVGELKGTQYSGEEKMTLIIYIPFKNGALMISDRQNTYFEDLTREPINKIIALPKFKVILGFAGSTKQCRYLIDQLRRDNGTLTFEETYERVYRRCYGSPELGFRSDDVEMLALQYKSTEEGIVLHRILGPLMNEVDRVKCQAIGGGAKYIGPQLQLDTLTISKEKAEEFGLTLLAYASTIDISVGNPATYDYNEVFIDTQIGAILTPHPTNVSIEKLLYKFE